MSDVSVQVVVVGFKACASKELGNSRPDSFRFRIL